MLSMDAFRGDAFSAISLTASVDRMGYVPGFLGSMPGLIVPKPIRTTDVWVEERENAPVLIQTSLRGSDPQQRGGDRRKARSFRTVRLAEASTIHADELQNIRAFGDETELEALQMEVGRRQMKIRQDFDLTMENMRLGVIQGVVVDADGSVINDWAQEFGITPDAEFTFNLGPSAVSGEFVAMCNKVRRAVAKDLKGVGGTGVMVHALASDEFWDQMVKLREVRETYQFAMNAGSLQNNVGGAWESFRFGNIMWHNYRGSDDGKLSIAPGKVKFFPTGAGIFQQAQAPAERFEFVNTLGQTVYSWTVPDLKRDMFVDIEMFSYPLFICTMPGALKRGGMTTT